MKTNVILGLGYDCSEVNVIPRITSKQLGRTEMDMVPCNKGVRAFDGTRRQVLGMV